MGQRLGGMWGNLAARMPGWRDRAGKAVTGENYVEGGKSRGMTQEEIDLAKKRRGTPGRTALELNDTLGGER